MARREHLAPTDILCIIAFCGAVVLYTITKEAEWKTVIVGLIGMFAGRQTRLNQKFNQAILDKAD